MKKTTKSFSLFLLLSIGGLILQDSSIFGQETLKTASPLPENINKIVTASCMPCHTSNGGILSRAKLNFTEWTQYSPEKQKAKAEKMYSVLKKGAMPPKSARETNPDIVPNKDQIETVRKWAESLKIVN